MNLTGLQKAALITTGAAAAYKALLYSLGLTVGSSVLLGGVDAAAVLRVVFALLGFVAFDLVIVSVVIDLRTHGFAWAGAAAGIVAAAVSGALALQVAGVVDQPALHASPAATMLAYAAHLVLSHAPRRSGAAPLAVAAAAVTQPQQTAAVDLTIINAPVAQAAAAPPQLPRTVREFIAARARELGTDAPPALAAELGTSPDTVRRALALIQTEPTERSES